MVLLAEYVDEGARLVVPIIAGGIERGRMVGGRGLQGVQHVLHAQLDVLRELMDRGRAAGLGGQALVCLLDLQCLLLRASRNVHGPAEIAEVTLQLTENGRDRKGGEGCSPLDVEAAA